MSYVITYVYNDRPDGDQFDFIIYDAASMEEALAKFHDANADLCAVGIVKRMDYVK